MDDKAYQNLLHEFSSLSIPKPRGTGPLGEGTGSSGLTMTQILELSDEARQLLTWMIRKNRFQDQELAERLSVSITQARKLLYMMLSKGLISELNTEQPEKESEYRTNISLSPKYKVPKNISDLTGLKGYSPDESMSQDWSTSEDKK